ncbi:MAG TPA: RICIN domain-containing protein [Glycomyces sp.]|nr:RICIN domain-containing protein [Glycomyces sp.]
MPRRLQLGQTPGAEVRQWTCSDAVVQDWNLTPVGNGYYSISNVYSGLCLDNYNFGTESGAEVRQWTCLNNAAQQWAIAKVNTEAPRAAPGLWTCIEANTPDRHLRTDHHWLR